MGRDATIAASSEKYRKRVDAATDNTHQNDGQESESSRPDTCVHCKYSEALQNVCCACR